VIVCLIVRIGHPVVEDKNIDFQERFYRLRPSPAIYRHLGIVQHPLALNRSTALSDYESQIYTSKAEIFLQN